jgi:hypothetical protein
VKRETPGAARARAIDNAAAARDLAYLRELTEATRAATMLSGTYYLLWGGLCTLGLLYLWLASRGLIAAGPWAVVWVWIVVGLVGGGVTAWLSVREQLRAPAIGHAAHRIGMTWVGTGIAIGVLFFVGVLWGEVPGPAMSGLVALFLGLGLWQNGLLAGIRWLRNLALLWWLGAAWLLVDPGPHSTLILAAMVLGLYTLPGWWLARQRNRPSSAA